MDEDGARTFATTIGTLYRAAHDQMREHVRGMDHGTLNWKPLPLANSVAVLIVHTLGSEREAIHAARSVTAERDRDAEFKAEGDAQDLLALLDEADRGLDLLGSLTAADLTELRPRGDRPPRPGLDSLVSNYGHTREHLAQIELTKQLYDSRT
ncbi:MAG: DinB family protein [Candidatus Dormibacteraceae bacterium]